MHHDDLDNLKFQLSLATLERASLPRIRQKSLANLARWRAAGTWGLVYDEWHELISCGSDAEIVGIMTGLDENSNRLRQSPPYVGIVDEDTREKLVAAAVSASQSRKK
jgi:hypothetical protein